MNVTVGITGASGQIGSALVRYLCAQPDVKVVAILRNPYLSHPLRATSGCEVRIGSLTDPRGTCQLLGGCDAVINCAISQTPPRFARTQNELLLSSIVHGCTALGHLRHMIHLSSVSVYGLLYQSSSQGSFQEPVSDTPYGRDKRYAEQVLERMAKPLAKDVQVSILRLGHVYGPDQQHSRNFFDLLRNPFFALPFLGENCSNAVHIDTLGKCLLSVIRGEVINDCGVVKIYNVLDNPERTWREVYELHSSAMGYPEAPRLDYDISSKLNEQVVREHTRSRLKQAWQEVVQPTISAGIQNFIVSPAVRDIGHQILTTCPLAFERVVKDLYTRISTRAKISPRASLMSAHFDTPIWYFSDRVPGPSLSEFVDTFHSTRETQISNLREWARGFTTSPWNVLGNDRAVLRCI